MLTDIIAGTGGGIAVVLVGHPFDTTKTRLQTAPAQFYNGTIDCIKKTYRLEGMKGFYAGICSPLAGQMIFRGISFSTFYLALNANKKYLYDTSILTYNQMLVVTGAMTGLAITFVETPIDVVKTKLQVQVFQNKLNPVFKPNYYNCRECTSYLTKTYGIPGMFQGFGATLIRNIPANALFFSVNEMVKNEFAKHNNVPVTDISVAQKFFAGSCGGLSYWVTMYPLDVIKSKMQSIDFHHAKSWKEMASHIWQNHGIKGFYQGVIPCATRSLFACGVMFTTVDMIRGFLHSATSTSATAPQFLFPEKKTY